MNEISLADINGFASTIEHSALTTVGDPQTKTLLFEILERLAAVEEENHQKDEKIAALEDRLAELEKDHNEVADFNARERATDRQRLAKLETPEITASPSEKTEAHVNHVRALLLKADFHRETVKFLGSRLGVSKRQTWNIIYEMERRGLVNVIWDPHHKQRRLVELRQMRDTSQDI